MTTDEIDRVVRSARASATATEILQKYIKRGGVFNINIKITEADLRQFITNVVNYAFVASNARELEAIIEGAFKSIMEKKT